MKEFLVNINLTEQTFYLAVILLVMGQGLKALSFINKRKILWILIIISILINFIFYGFTFFTFIEAIIATSLSSFIYDLIKISNIKQ